MELRPFHLHLSLESLHGNAEQPAAYTTAIVVLDHVLPTKGVSYRLPRSGGSQVESPNKVAKADVNVWLGSNALSNWWIVSRMSSSFCLCLLLDYHQRFVGSLAWKNQAFKPDGLPCAIPESDYVAPNYANMTSNDARKNWTDVQETSQWLGGVDVPQKLLEALGVGGPSDALSDSVSYHFSNLCRFKFQNRQILRLLSAS